MYQSLDDALKTISTGMWECDNPDCWCKNPDNPTSKSLKIVPKMLRDKIVREASENTKARTYDEGKPPLAWLPWAAITELAKVQQYGHTKYKDFNNYRKGLEVSRNLSCALRHIRDYLSGVDVDAESGLSPLAHALCRVAFVLQNIADGVEIDDRYKKP